MLATRWQQCYTDTWQDSMVPEAFCHPAKYSRGLIHRIYRHMLEQGYIAPGMTVLDPFGGVALGALDAMTYGLRWIGVELEPRFVELGKKNLDLWRQRYGFTGGTLVQGDSRRLRDILLPYSGVQAVVGSPPFLETAGGSAARSVDVALVGRRANTRANGYYGTTTGQLGAMPPGAVVSSPPWDGGAPALVPERQRETSDSRDHGGPGPQYQAMTKLGAVVSSPPFGRGDSAGPASLHRRTDASAQAMRQIGGWNQGGGQTSPENLAAATTDTFWSAAATIMQELALRLPAGAVCAWVVKSYVKNKQIVPFPDQWRALCEQHGFNLVEEIHASLVEDHGTQEGLFGEAQRVTTEKKSFFRRLAEKKGSPRIDHETVLIVRKAGSGAGVCCVSSPPFSVPGNQPPNMRAHAPVRQKWVSEPDRPDTYGTTPGNLGNLPVGRP